MTSSASASVLADGSMHSRALPQTSSASALYAASDSRSHMATSVAVGLFNQSRIRTRRFISRSLAVVVGGRTEKVGIAKPDDLGNAARPPVVDALNASGLGVEPKLAREFRGAAEAVDQFGIGM